VCRIEEKMEEDNDAYSDSESEEGTTSVGAIVQSMQLLLQHSDNTMTDAVTEIVCDCSDSRLSEGDREDLRQALETRLARTQRLLQHLTIETPFVDIDKAETKVQPEPGSNWSPWNLSRSLIAIPFRALSALRSSWSPAKRPFPVGARKDKASHPRPQRSVASVGVFDEARMGLPGNSCLKRPAGHSRSHRSASPSTREHSYSRSHENSVRSASAEHLQRDASAVRPRRDAKGTRKGRERDATKGTQKGRQRDASPEQKDARPLSEDVTMDNDDVSVPPASQVEHVRMRSDLGRVRIVQSVQQTEAELLAELQRTFVLNEEELRRGFTLQDGIFRQDEDHSLSSPLTGLDFAPPMDLSGVEESLRLRSRGRAGPPEAVDIGRGPGETTLYSLPRPPRHVSFSSDFPPPPGFSDIDQFGPSMWAPQAADEAILQSSARSAFGAGASTEQELAVEEHDSEAQGGQVVLAASSINDPRASRSSESPIVEAKDEDVFVQASEEIPAQAAVGDVPSQLCSMPQEPPCRGDLAVVELDDRAHFANSTVFYDSATPRSNGLEAALPVPAQQERPIQLPDLGIPPEPKRSRWVDRWAFTRPIPPTSVV
jgi:hypothetical protein